MHPFDCPVDPLGTDLWLTVASQPLCLGHPRLTLAKKEVEEILAFELLPACN